MASVYPKQRSPYWYAKVWRQDGWKALKTPYRQDSPAGKRNALMWAEAQERVTVADRPLVRAEAWSTWVIPWLERTYAYNPKTLQRYLNAWKPVNEFLSEHEIPTARHWRYEHAARYVEWRKSKRRRRGTLINHNTAVTELKTMSRILTEAVQRGFADGNPLLRSGIRRQNTRHTPRMSEDEIATAREALKTKPAWMGRCFEIALHHGVRLSETQVPMDRVHLDPRSTESENRDRITFHCKGRFGEKKIHTVPLHPALRPLMLEIKKAKERFTCVLPPMAAKEWWKFRRDTGLSHLRFHSTRATVASLLAERGVPQQVAMDVLAHASATVHRAYLQLNAKPVGEAIRLISYGAGSAAHP